MAYTYDYDADGNITAECIYKDGATGPSSKTTINVYTYGDSNCMRTQKSDNTGTTNYYYDSDKNLIGMSKGKDTLLFYYDSDGNVTSFTYNGTMYYYIKNLQGDIVKIINQSGTEVAKYVYDAWGNIQSETGEPNIRQLNPFRYRSYVYDEETGLYYLQSRYYDPLSGKFLNADNTTYIGATGTVLSANIFAYCENNAVNNIDNNGNLKISLSKYKNRSWIVKLVAKYIPNITKSLYSKTIFNKSILGIRLEINLAYGFQTNSKKVLGMAMSKKGIEVSGSVSIGGNRSFSGGAGFDWGGLYLNFAIGYNVGNNIYCAIGLKLSVSYFTALAIAACCVAMPYVSTFVSSTIAAASVSIKTLGGIMASTAPKFIYCFI